MSTEEKPASMTGQQPARTSPKPAFCNTWPWPTSDLDIATPEENMAAHRARGCCEGSPTVAPTTPEWAVPAESRLRLLRARVAYVGSLDAEPLDAFLRRLADAAERAESEFCVRDDSKTESVSHVFVDWDDDRGWTGMLVIE